MKTLMKKVGLAASICAVSGFANASFPTDMKINLAPLGGNQYDIDAGALVGINDADAITAIFTELAGNNLLATSVYDFSDGDVNGTFYDTNRTSLLTSLGIPTGPVTAIDTTTPLSLTVPIDSAQIDIDALSPLVPPILGVDSEGFLFSWELVTEYTFEGVLGPGGPTYTGGSADIIFRETVAATTGTVDTVVLTLDLVGSTLNLANLDLFFDISFALDDFWLIDDGTGTFVDMNDLAGVPTNVVAKLDTNVNPPIPDPSQLWLNASAPTTPTGPLGAVLIRQSELNYSIETMTIPEPGTMLLLGAGLLGLAGRRRRRLS